MAMTESKERKVKYDLEELKRVNKKLKDDVSRELTTRLKTIILSVDGEYNQQKINHFVDNELFARDSKELRKYINEVTPDINLMYEFISDETGERREISLPMDVSFFWPST
jgi:DNA-binding transcriptional regulator GbsR (MarR family)